MAAVALKLFDITQLVEFILIQLPYNNEVKLDGTTAQKMYLTFPPTTKVELRTKPGFAQLSTQRKHVSEWKFPITITCANGVTVVDLSQELMMEIGNIEYRINHQPIARLPDDLAGVELSQYCGGSVSEVSRTL